MEKKNEAYNFNSLIVTDGVDLIRLLGGKWAGKAGTAEEGAKVEKKVPEFFVSFKKRLIQLTSTNEKSDGERLMQIIFDVGLYAKKLLQHVKGVEDCKWSLL